MYTIEDISKMTGVSISIISRYLNGKNVRKENKKLIDEAVKKTGYTANEFARNLRLKQTKCVGAIVPSLDDGFALSVMHYVEKELKKNGYTLFLSDCLRDESEEISCVKMMLQKRVDALIVLPIGNMKEISELTTAANVPLIVFDQYFSNISADYVLFENKEGARKACDVLLDNGHRDIAIILGPLGDYTPRQRFKGVKKSFEDRGIPLKEEFVCEAKDYSLASGYDFTMKALSEKNRPTAIFSTNFDMTLGVIKAINELNLTIPDDVSLMAFDFLPIYEAIKPKLWTVTQSIEKIGEKVAERVMTRMRDTDESPNTTFFISYELIEGKSVKKIN